MKAQILLSIFLIAVAASVGRSQSTAEEYWRLGFDSTQIGDRETALLYVEKALEVDPTYIPAYITRANIRRARRDFRGAIADYNKIIELEPKKKGVHADRGWMYFYTGDPDGAIADYYKEIELGGWGWLSYHRMGRAHENKSAKLIQRGEKEAGKSEQTKAIISFTKAIASDPKRAESYSWRSLLHSRNKDYALALTDINAALQIRPEFVDDYRSRIWIYRKTGKGDLAKADEEKIAELLAGR